MGGFLLISQLIMASKKNVRLNANKALKENRILHWISILLNRVTFQFRMIFEIMSVFMGPWEKIKNCETHGRTGRVGRSVYMTTDCAKFGTVSCESQFAKEQSQYK